jgi:antirestriction protein
VEIKMTNVLELNYLNLGNMAFDTLTLPATEEEINEFFEALNPMDSDCELQWVESDVTVNLNDLSLSQLQIVSELDNIEDFAMVFEAMDNRFEDAIEKLENGEYTIFTDCKNDYDLGWELASRNGIVDPNDDSILARYFDYEAYGRDCRFEGSFTQIDSETYVEIHY